MRPRRNTIRGITKLSARTKVRLIAGPTASGKSALAMQVAEQVGGVIVNADALQIYRDLRVLSARPSAEDEARVPHRLYGVADAAETWSTGRWLQAATAALDEIAAAGKVAVVTGGTGLYFRALTQGLADVPAIPDAVRAEARARLDEMDEAAFRADLRTRDAAAEARIAPGDRQRLARALEVHLATGRALSDWQADTRPTLAADAWEAVVVEPPREVLYARCDARFDAMLAHGALDEARALLARGLDPNLPAMKAVGLRELGRHLSGELSLEQAAALGRQETRRYAKRQLTWLRNQTPDGPEWSHPFNQPSPCPIFEASGFDRTMGINAREISGLDPGAIPGGSTNTFLRVIGGKAWGRSASTDV